MTALAAIHIGKKALGLDDETYRDLLERVTGKRSAGDMTEAQRSAVLAEFRRLGFERPSKGTEVGCSRLPVLKASTSATADVDAKRPAGGLTGPFAKKLLALWISAYQLGVVEDRSDAALLAFVERQTGLSHVRFLRDSSDARAAIEALKAWLSRKAQVDWSPRKTGPDYRNNPKFRVVEAQWGRLIDAGGVHIKGDSWRTLVATAAFETGKPGFEDLDDADWTRLAATLGRRLRAALARRPRAA